LKHLAALIIVTLVVAVPAHAKPKYAGKAGGSRLGPSGQATVENSGSFSPAERNLIRAHLLGEKPAAPLPGETNLPAGLQKKIARGGDLPPGWQKKVVPGHGLDYHIYRQGESLPDPLLQKLPPPPAGAEILRIENKIVLLNSATRNILDAFDLKPSR
jgi:hypothetical protein